MPNTVVSLLFFVVLLVPGLLHYIQRRRQSEQPELSALFEAGTLTFVSLITDGVTALLFAFVRVLWPRHTPDIEALIHSGATYAAPRLGTLLLWGSGFVIVSSTLAVVWAVKPGALKKIPWDLAPDFVDTTAWSYLFESVPDDSAIYVGCDLTDGSYVGGKLAWFSTSLNENVDRALILAEPLTVVKNGAPLMVNFQRTILSARDISTIYVSYVDKDAKVTVAT